jgi:hypothetical protein
MSDDFNAAVEVHQRERFEAAVTMYSVQKTSGDKVREQTQGAYRRLRDAHLLITGVLATGLLRTNGKIVRAADGTAERSALIASYVIGMVCCERAIEEGRYLQAHALLRQEMETLAQLKAVSRGSRNETRPPNIAVLEESLRRFYDELSGAAHVSKHYIVQAATEYATIAMDTSAVRHFPAFDEGLARRSFTLHLC